jgi:hypothetical protein
MIEIRRVNGNIDEVVGHDCSFHIEMLSDDGAYMTVEDEKGEVMLNIWADRKCFIKPVLKMNVASEEGKVDKINFGE